MIFTGIIFFSYLTDFSYFHTIFFFSKSCKTWSEQVKNGPFYRGWRWFQPFSYFHTIQLFSYNFVFPKVARHGQNRLKIDLFIGGEDGFSHFHWFSVIFNISVISWRSMIWGDSCYYCWCWWNCWQFKFLFKRKWTYLYF
jgi:hypothetical protein